MPYIITTETPSALGPTVTRRAVATLEETRSEAEATIYRISGEYEDARFSVCEAHYRLLASCPSRAAPSARCRTGP
jgi:hypothetical protein